MILKIVNVKNPILRSKAKAVDTKILNSNDKKIVGLIADMKATLQAQKDPEGVGLAAPQVGKSLQLFIVNYKNLQRVIINPVVLEIAKTKITNKKGKRKVSRKILEGCLSLPHYYGPIKRAGMIKIKYLNEEGKEMIEQFKGFEAQIIQHEIDHLNGILFIDHILEQKSPLYQFKGADWEEVELI